MSKSRLNDCNIIVFCTHVNSQWDRGSQFSTVIPSMLLEILTNLPLWFVCVPVFVCVCVMHCSWLLLCVHMYIAIAPWEANEISGMSNGRVLLLLTIWICVDASCINRQTWVWLGGLLVSCCCRWACGWWMWQILKTSAGGERSCLAIIKELTRMIQFGYTTELRHRCMSDWSCHLCWCLSYICQWAES